MDLELKLEFEIGILNWNFEFELEFGIGIWNWKLEFGIGLCNTYYSKPEKIASQLVCTLCLFLLLSHK